MAGYTKGVVWVNGHNLGRYWDIGPQTKLYCPASWLKKGANEIIVFDLHKTDASPLRGADRREHLALPRPAPCDCCMTASCRLFL